jgi:Co/Zn/Cd efflux system component
MADDCCDGNIDTSAMQAHQRRVLAIVLAINVVTFIIMVTGAWLSGSSSLLSGTLDNLGDALTYGLSFAVVGASAGAKGRVAFFKGCLILAAAIAVAGQITWRLLHLDMPVVAFMGGTALLNLAANAVCLWLLTPLRHDDVNMSSVWECSRNDIFDGVAVIATTGLVWLFRSGWPDVLVATALLAIFLRSATRVLRNARHEIREVRV